MSIICPRKLYSKRNYAEFCRFGLLVTVDMRISLIQFDLGFKQLLVMALGDIRITLLDLDLGFKQLLVVFQQNFGDVRITLLDFDLDFEQLLVVFQQNLGNVRIPLLDLDLGFEQPRGPVLSRGVTASWFTEFVQKP
jgi:hypothetical protein